MIRQEKWDFIENLTATKREDYKDGEGKRGQSYDYNYFTNKRINSKFNSLVLKYKSVIDRDMLLDYSKDIILDILFKDKGDIKDKNNIKNKDYILISEEKEKGKYKDDINYIVATLGQRINNKVDKYRGTYRDRSDGKDEQVNTLVFSLDDEYKDRKGTIWNLTDTVSNEQNIFYTEPIEETEEEVEKALQKIYVTAQLTEREIEILQALERTRDNTRQKTYYNKAEASRILGDCTRENVTQIFSNIKRKVARVYKIEYTRQDRISELYNLLDSIQNEIDIINYINDNLDNDNGTEEILYKINSQLVQYFLKNRYNICTYKSDMMRKFVTYFIKEIYNYLELLKRNDILGDKSEDISLTA